MEIIFSKIKNKNNCLHILEFWWFVEVWEYFQFRIWCPCLLYEKWLQNSPTLKWWIPSPLDMSEKKSIFIRQDNDIYLLFPIWCRKIQAKSLVCSWYVYVTTWGWFLVGIFFTHFINEKYTRKSIFLDKLPV